MLRESSKWGKFDLERQGRLLHKTKGNLTKVFCTFGPNLMILAWTSYGTDKQVIDTQTDRHTQRRRQRQYMKANLASGKTDIMSISGATCDAKVVIMTILGFQWSTGVLIYTMQQKWSQATTCLCTDIK